MIRSLLALSIVGICFEAHAQAPAFQQVTLPASIQAITSAKGIAVGDYDNDGDQDIFLATSNASESNKLLRNEGGMTFTDVTQTSGLTYNSRSQMGLWVDVDNDGWLDLYLGDHLANRFYHNNQNGTFTESTSGAGLQQQTYVNALMAGDLNGDRWLDIYSNNFNYLNNLFANRGNGTFIDKATSSGAESFGDGMGGMMVDIDNDNDLDIYLVFDNGNPNILFINDGKGNFTDASRAYNVNYKGSGMGVDKADFDHDGYQDIYITNLFDNVFYSRTSPGKYTNRALSAGVDDKGMTWGVVVLDYDNDGYDDIYIANDYGFSTFPNRLYHNNGDNTFTSVSDGTSLDLKENSYCVARADLDNDGAEDLLVASTGAGGVKIFKNTTSTNNWVQVSLIGTVNNKFGVGARVKITSGDTVQTKEVTAGSGYAVQNELRVTAGMGTQSQVDELRVVWPDGTESVYTNMETNKHYLVVEGQSLTVFDATTYHNQLISASQMPVPPDTLMNNTPPPAQHSVARLWNEAQLDAIRIDLARPTVHARNLFQVSAAMYDAWAAFEPGVSTFLLGKEHGSFYCPFTGIQTPVDKVKAQEEAISYAAFRLLKYKFLKSPGSARSLAQFYKLFDILGYDEGFLSDDYSTGSPAALGNYIAYQMIEYAAQDGANELNSYQNQYYQPVNAPFNPIYPGCAPLKDANHWQPIKLNVSIDQNGNPVSSTQSFLSAEWGNVAPFAMTEADRTLHTRNGSTYPVYHDPGQFPMIDTLNGGGLTSEYQWSFELVSIWASHLDPTDGVMVDVSPGAIGNIAQEDYPTTVQGLRDFYKFTEGGDIGSGHPVNPKTGQPYASQVVPRGDYTRVLAEFWADGPTSETPPGHWYTIVNYVSDHPQFIRKFHGEGEVLTNLEWDVKAYLTLGGAVHDAAIAAWGIKGYYDGIRPISAIRSMAARGQASNPSLPGYHPAGLPLVPGFVELVEEGDPLAGAGNEHVGKVKLYTWYGPPYITDPGTDDAGVGWILAENWWPYQRPTFVTPPFAGYISGHSTYSSAAAQVLTLLTGDAYFPGGLGEFKAKQNEYLVFEEGPSVDVILQWATYKDAADQCSLSRIWGGIHPPFDDIPGRLIGTTIGQKAYELAVKYFNGEIVTAATPGEHDTSVNIFPNPASGSRALTVQVSTDWLGSEIVLRDHTGRLVRQTSVMHQQEYLDVSGLAPGIYLVTLKRRSGKSVTQKIIVQP